MNLTWMSVPGSTVIAVAIVMHVMGHRFRMPSLRRSAPRVAGAGFVLLAFGSIVAIHGSQSAILAVVLSVPAGILTWCFFALRAARRRTTMAQRHGA
ncbi:hypothetical protein [Agreia sp. COWG]|uniref:hypothetical protein n=1 Tax=Agreia sp. COWG TaxID=2773266 RepID=UPI001926A48B|nr:hypothetical protein [Agreia sp. COWG]